MIYTMMQAREATGMTYQGLKFYCNEGLVPNVKRDIAWIKSLLCLRDCGMGIQEMREYLDLCLKGPSTIPERKEILNAKKAEVEKQLSAVEATLKFIDNKQKFYDDVLAGKREYVSNLIPCSCQTESTGKSCLSLECRCGTDEENVEVRIGKHASASRNLRRKIK